MGDLIGGIVGVVILTIYAVTWAALRISEWRERK